METTKIAIFKGKDIKKIIHKKNNKTICRHDYKNAIKIGNVDYVCPLCRNLLDPMEWFFMNSFEFVEVFTENEKVAEKDENVAENSERKLKRPIVSKANYLPKSRKKLKR